MSEVRDCIVSYIDMAGIKSLLSGGSRDAVKAMRQMHKAVSDVGLDLSSHEEVCLWNDSVLMIGFVDDSRSSYRILMDEVCAVKRTIDEIMGSYAICIKGRAFPSPPQFGTQDSTARSRLLYLHASSLAFANCFEIENQARKHKWEWEWYIDSRIKTKLSLRPGDNSQNIELHPRRRARKVHMYAGNPWDAGKSHKAE